MTQTKWIKIGKYTSLALTVQGDLFGEERALIQRVFGLIDEFKSMEVKEMEPPIDAPSTEGE